MTGHQSTSKLASRGLKPTAVLAANRAHGERIRYLGGCRCDACRRANTDYERARVKARNEGDWNGIVPAFRARTHLIALSKINVGRRAIADATDIGNSILHEIKTGRRKNIRARTERKILAVTVEMAAPRAMTDASDTWKLLNELLEKGYKKYQIAQKLGYSKSLQFKRDLITVHNAFKVRRLFEKLKATGFADAKPAALPKNTTSPKRGMLVHRMED